MQTWAYEHKCGHWAHWAQWTQGPPLRMWAELVESPDFQDLSIMILPSFYTNLHCFYMSLIWFHIIQIDFYMIVYCLYLILYAFHMID